MSLASATIDEFKTTYIPYFDKQGIAYKYVDGVKHIGKGNSKNINLFFKEIMGFTHTFITYDGYVWRFKLIHPAMHQTDSSQSPKWMGPFNMDNFEPVTPALLIPASVADTVVLASSLPPATVPTSPVMASPVPAPTVYPAFVTNSDHTQFILGCLEHMKEVAVTKADDYHRHGNPFHNFDRTAKRKGITPERALFDMVSKQLTSMEDFIDDIDEQLIPSEARARDVLGDIRLYMMMLEGLIRRRHLALA